MEDSFIHKNRRARLIQELRNEGINDENVLNAMNTLPRHFFLDTIFYKHAYENKPFSIGCGQTISHPLTVAFMSESLIIKKRDRVLEIGTGSGYQACILAMLGASVFSIERQKELYKETNSRLDKLGFRQIRTYLKDGYKGLAEFAPYDKIIVTAGAPFVPQPLLDQLKIGGRMLIPVGKTEEKSMLIIDKLAEGEFKEQIVEGYKFVPLLEGTA